MWKMGSDVHIVDVGDGVFQFKFSMESQLKWVLATGHWSFEDHPLVLCKWEQGMTAASVRFTSIPMWVQISGLPFDLLSKDVGRDIGNGLGKVVDVDMKAFSTDQAHFLCVRVELPLEKLLRRGGVVASPEGDKVCIGFKYERLVGLCFKCVRIGHEARYCSFHVDCQQEFPYGEWLKAGFRKTNTSVNNGGRSELRVINTQVGPSRRGFSMPSARENIHSEFDVVGIVIRQNQREVVSTGSLEGPSKGGAVAETVEEVGTAATVVLKPPPDFEALITELDQAI
nr:uncharacterized protein CFP56_64479 [Quercus suber]